MSIKKLSTALKKISFQLNDKTSSHTFYHTSPRRYQPGEIIKPYWNLEHGHLDTENLFEKIRKEKYHDAPSRFNAVFCWNSYDEATEDAAHFIDSGRPRYLYQVAPLGKNYSCNVHAYNNAVSAQEADRAYWAEKYWNDDDPNKEVLIENGVKVISVIDLF